MIETLIEHYQQLEQAMIKLQQSITQEARPGWICQAEQRPAYKTIANSYGDWWYDGDGDGRRTKNYHGLILASPETANLARSLNVAKQQFQQLVQQLQKTDRQAWLLNYPRLLPSNKRNSLKSVSLARLHLKQCYRQIPVLDSCPEKIGFSWYCSGKSIQRVSKNEAIKKLAKLGQAKHIQIQQQRLAALPDNEDIAIVQPQAPCIRANIVYNSNGKITRKACNSALPFLIVSDDNSLPLFNQIERQPPNKKTRLQRSDTKIAEQAIAPSIRGHLYQ
ncbi:hypothetical protein EDC56_0175 [Sinobacterium caligoides]|uniref:DNA replication terminus site binding protein n=1 Tax=Sinobacterium caligoides TaxID=933926 RepID=A0A3N2DYB3_9GAMM|nr:DNA replication terminus site-binding protein [Sinobacterium caligoides]ROS04662.1 hypothetical protein EDC56_0175 [Sinobacterium caligoides]